MALRHLRYLNTMTTITPVNVKVAYAFAAIPSRYYLENHNWTGAATAKAGPAGFAWNKFPWQESMIHLTRLLGAAHLGRKTAALEERQYLRVLYDTLMQQKDPYKSKQVAIRLTTGEAWIRFLDGKTAEGLSLMRLAADMEDSTEKHPVTPGEVLPARELLGDMLMESGKYPRALQEYEVVLGRSPNRFNSLFGAGRAAEKSGDAAKAVQHYTALTTVVGDTRSNRRELSQARNFLAATAHSKANKHPYAMLVDATPVANTPHQRRINNR